MKIVHVGFRVAELDRAIALYEGLGFSIASRFEKPEPRAQVAVMNDEKGTGIELWEFEQDHPLNEFIGRHIAFSCESVLDDARELVARGFEEVIPYTEGVTLNYIFFRDEYGTVFELAEEKIAAR